MKTRCPSTSKLKSSKKKNHVISNSRKRKISKLKTHKSLPNRRLIFSSFSKQSRTPVTRQDNLPILSIPELSSDSDSSQEIIIHRRKKRRLLELNSTTSESDEQNSLKPAMVESSTDDTDSAGGKEIWCRGICNILPDYCTDEHERKWIQCYKCRGWWHQEHANLRSLMITTPISLNGIV